MKIENIDIHKTIENAKNHPLYAHITLQKGERSQLANLATDLL